MHQFLLSFAVLGLLALPLPAQEEALYGAWEGHFVDGEVGEVTVHMTFQADGTCAIDQVIQVKEDLLAAEGSDISAIERLDIRSNGIYGVEGDSLWVDITEFELLVDGQNQDLVEVLTELGRSLARWVADLTDISDDDYPAYEKEVVDELLAGFSEEQLLAEFDGGIGTYAIEDDTLLLTTVDELGVSTMEFRRVDTASAVAPTSWGSLKAAWRP